MSPNLHAVVMIAIPAATAAICVWGRRGPGTNAADRGSQTARRPSVRRLLFGLLAVAGFFLVGQLLEHACDRGDPDVQILVGALCILASVVLPHSRWHAIGGAAVVALVLGYASWDYVELVHRPGLTGNPAAHVRLLEYDLQESRQLLAAMAATENEVYAAGWLQDAVPATTNAPQLQDRITPRPFEEAVPFWHTPFTRLWALQVVRKVLWYPGGTLPEAASRLEYRDLGAK